MAYSADYSVDVKAPQTNVFDYVADVSRHGEWGSADDHMKATAEKPGPPEMGSRYKAEGVLNGKLNNSTVTITALDSPRRLAFDAEDSNSVFHHEIRTQRVEWRDPRRAPRDDDQGPVSTFLWYLRLSAARSRRTTTARCRTPKLLESGA